MFGKKKGDAAAQADDKPKLSAAQLRPMLPIIALVLAGLAAWLAWGGWQQWQGQSRQSEMIELRDQVELKLVTALAKQRTTLTNRLASPDVQKALQQADMPAASSAIATGWEGPSQVLVVPTGLESHYAGLPGTGYGQLAAAESALAQDRVVARVVQQGGKQQLMLAAPAKTGNNTIGVVLATFPENLVTSALDPVAGNGTLYFALRQGPVTLRETGDQGLANAGERNAKDIDDTDLRVAAAMPVTGTAPFGLSAIPALAGAVVMLLLAGLAFRESRRRDDGSNVGATDDDAPTLAQALQHEQMAESIAIKVAEQPRAPKPAQVLIDRGIFRAYDIRGVVGKTLDAGIAEMIGQSVGSLMREQNLDEIVIGRDGRLSGPDLVDGLIKGLRKAGRNVIDIGLAPTPLVYFGTYHLRTGCGIAVTGSHNPPDYNGFKIVVGGETLSGDAILDLHTRIAEDRLFNAPELGSLSSRNIDDAYVERIASDVQAERRLKVVVDAGNGVAGELGPRVLEAIGIDVIPLFCDIDGEFPNHHPDPSDESNLRDLVQTVQRMQADLGIAFDGDGDRLGVVTPDGENIYPDRLLMLFASDVLERNPGAVILFDVKSTGRLPGHILRHGGSPQMCKTGHSLIKAKMREVEAELAGEMSGHFFFGERWYGFDDGIYAAARLLEILANLPESPSETLKALPVGVSTPEIKVPFEGDAHAFVEAFRAKATFEGARISTLDGVRADWPDGWGLVRASNTTPILVLRFDADNPDALERIKAVFRNQLLAAKADLPLEF